MKIEVITVIKNFDVKKSIEGFTALAEAGLIRTDVLAKDFVGGNFRDFIFNNEHNVLTVFGQDTTAVNDALTAAGLTSGFTVTAEDLAAERIGEELLILEGRDGNLLDAAATEFEAVSASAAANKWAIDGLWLGYVIDAAVRQEAGRETLDNFGNSFIDQSTDKRLPLAVLRTRLP